MSSGTEKAGPQMQSGGMDDGIVARAKELGFEVESRADGWYLTGELGEEVGPFAEPSNVEEFLNWLASLPKNNGEG